MPDGNDKLSRIGQLFDKVSAVKLRGGVVGKLSLVLIITAVSMAIMSWAVQDVWVSGGGIAASFILVLTLGLRLVSFADKHPEAALFEGAEFLRHEQLVMAMKGHPQIPFDPADLAENPEAPPRLAPPAVDHPDADDTTPQEDEHGG